MNADSYFQLMQIERGHFDDWHSPFLAVLWWGLHALLPGPAGLLILINLLVWGSLAWIAAMAQERVGAPATVLVLLPLLPGLFNFLGHIHKDALLVGWLLFATASAASACWRTEGSSRMVLRRIVAALACVAAFLTRPNVVFALLPVLYLATMGLSRPRRIAYVGLALAAMPTLYVANGLALDVQQRHAGDSVKLYHLLGLSYLTGQNQLPGTWSAAESDAIVASCYSPIQWDGAIWGNCSFIHQGLEKQGIWGSRRLSAAWLGAIVHHPLETYSVWAALYRLSTRTPNSWQMFRQVPAATPSRFVVPRHPMRPATQIAESYLGSSLVQQGSRPMLFAGILLAAAALQILRGRSGSPLGRLAITVALSGAIYMTTYFPVNVSAEYRYFYWCGYAAWLALALCGLDLRAASCHRRGLKSVTAVALAIVVSTPLALALAPFKLPTAPRQIAISSEDSAQVRLLELRTASLPNWLAGSFEGGLDASGWILRNGAYESSAGAGPFTSKITTLLQSIRVRLASGPDSGVVRIEHDGQVLYVDARSDTPGEVTLTLPTPSTLSDMRRYASWGAPLRAMLWLLVFCGGVFLLNRRAQLYREERGPGGAKARLLETA
ncbi:MAG: hypothetical protein KDG55_07720 [Rhodocyclaceae bacterium]|nr:hypothetical protein [Rhodocyclaceae bacterium]